MLRPIKRILRRIQRILSIQTLEPDEETLRKVAVPLAVLFIVVPIAWGIKDPYMDPVGQAFGRWYAQEDGSWIIMRGGDGWIKYPNETIVPLTDGDPRLILHLPINTYLMYLGGFLGAGALLYVRFVKENQK